MKHIKLCTPVSSHIKKRFFTTSNSLSSPQDGREGKDEEHFLPFCLSFFLVHYTKLYLSFLIAFNLKRLLLLYCFTLSADCLSVFAQLLTSSKSQTKLSLFLLLIETFEFPIRIKIFNTHQPNVYYTIVYVYKPLHLQY